MAYQIKRKKQINTKLNFKLPATGNQALEILLMLISVPMGWAIPLLIYII